MVMVRLFSLLAIVVVGWQIFKLGRKYWLAAGAEEEKEVTTQKDKEETE